MKYTGPQYKTIIVTLGLKQKQIAEMTGMSQEKFSKIIREDLQMTEEFAFKTEWAIKELMEPLIQAKENDLKRLKLLIDGFE